MYEIKKTQNKITRQTLKDGKGDWRRGYEMEKGLKRLKMIKIC